MIVDQTLFDRSISKKMKSSSLLIIAACVFSNSLFGNDLATFSEHIAPIVFEKCASCHRPGEAAPFSLTDYKTVKRKAKTIQRVVGEGIMPPWLPEQGWGDFRGNLSLTDSEIKLFDQWVENGMAEGDSSKTPELPDFPEGWSLGEPDVVLEMDAAFEIRAEGRDIYRHFTLPLALKEDRWVKAVEVRPSARSVVHHVLFFLDDTGKARKLDEADKGPGFSGKGFRSTGSLGGWAVGGSPLDLGAGFAMPLRKGSDLVIQTHFHPTGKVEHEKTKIGLYFADAAPERELVEFQVPPGFGARTGLNVAPGETQHELRDHFIVPEDLELVTAWGHAHQVCSSMQAEATLPDGTTKKLIRIGDWKFNWQGQYAYKKPVPLPKGTRIDVVITYDNSPENPSNPFSPPRRIFWGEQSNDEMGSLIFQCVASDKSKVAELKSGIKRQQDLSQERFLTELRTGVRRLLVLKQDANGDDQLELSEAAKEHHFVFKMIDNDKNGFVTVEEIDANAKVLDKLLQRK